MDNENSPVTSMTATESRPKVSWLQAIVLGRNPRNTVIRIAILLPVSFIVFHFVLLPIRVTGISMLPTYQDHTINFVNQLAYARHEPKRGDVVSIRFAGMHVMYLKRIIALPGETVGFQNGHVIINGEVLPEPYETTDCDWNVPAVHLGANEYFVVGDNRTMPAENHVFGKVARDHIVGKAVL